MAERLIIDTDPATGYAFRDVDDGLAILYLLGCPAFRVEAIATVYGNVSLKRATPKAFEVLRVAGIEGISVAGGASGPGDESDTAASKALKEAALSRPGTLSVLAIGPLTNIARAGRDPAFFPSLKRLVVMGGALERPGRPRAREFNFMRDQRAASLVMEAPCDKTVITFDLCKQVVFKPRDLAELKTIGSAQSDYIAKHAGPWLLFNRLLPFVSWKGGFVPWDVIAAVYMVRPDLFLDEYSGPVTVPRRRVPSGAISFGGDGPRVTVPRRIADPSAVIEEFLNGIRLLSETSHASLDSPPGGGPTIA